MTPRKNGYVCTTGFGEMTWHKNSSSLTTFHISLPFPQHGAGLVALPGEGYPELLSLQGPRAVLIQLILLFLLMLLEKELIFYLDI